MILGTNRIALALLAAFRPMSGRLIVRIAFGLPLLAGLAILVVASLSQSVLAGALQTAPALPFKPSGTASYDGMYDVIGAVDRVVEEEVGTSDSTSAPVAEQDWTNILLITVSDINWDSVGAFGSPVEGATPNIDRLAAEGLRFEHAHVMVSACTPSRSALMTGRYPHVSGGEGFHDLRLEGVPILPGILQDAGYEVGVLGHVRASTPYDDFQWDMEKSDSSELGWRRNPEVYYQDAKSFVQDAVDGDSPFFLVANLGDAHRPFYGNDPDSWYTGVDTPAVPPSRVFAPEEVTVPGFLPDIADVRLEIAEYYSSLRRGDDAVGGLLDALDEVGVTENTLVVLLADNAMGFPFAKSNVYLNSTRTPWIVRWPEVVQPAGVDAEHFISGIDYLPTVLDAIDVDIPEGVNGKSFLPLLQGETQDGREQVFTQFYESPGEQEYPMRSVQNARFGYIFNAWSDGVRRMTNDSQSGRSWNAMEDAAANDPALASRNHFFTYRVPEEFYDYENDPDALTNLIADPNYANEIQALRDALKQWMVDTNDPLLPVYRDRTLQRPPAFIEGTTAIRAVSENSEAGQAIGPPVVAADPENDPLTYALSGTDADSFSIVASTGQLLTSAALDYKSNSSHSVNISVSDGRDADRSPDTETDDTIAVTITILPDGIPDGTVWWADMQVVDLGNGSIGAVRSDLFSNIGGSAGLQAKWLWYYAPTRTLRLAFTETVPDGEDLTLHVGELALTLAAGESSFSWEDVDVAWEDGQTIGARVSRFAATPEEAAAWTTTLTVETRSGYSGYSVFGSGLGALSSTDFEVDGTIFGVGYVALLDGDLIFGLAKVLRSGFVLQVGDEEFPSADATLQRAGAAYRFSWQDAGLVWSDDDEVEVSLFVGQSTPASMPNPLSGFTAVNAEDQTDLGPLADQATLRLADSDNGSYSIRADTNGWAEFIGSIRLELSGAKSVAQTVDSAPYTLYGGGLPAGSYTLRATAYSQQDLGGEVLGTLEIGFTVEAGEPLTADEEAAAWTTTLTVETRSGYSGYSVFGSGLGALSSTDFEVDGTIFGVGYVALLDGDLIFGLAKVLRSGFVLRVGDEEFPSADATLQRAGAAYRFSWQDAGLVWSDDDEVEVSLFVGQSTPASMPNPLSGFTAVNAEDQTDLGPLADQATLRLADSDNGSYSIRADTNGWAEFIGSIRLELSGAKTADRTANSVPYTL